jgi:2-polyprenyl-3-methyl-5-hydroxy-6-metoxy-1,4-benzoquinol methylase
MPTSNPYPIGWIIEKVIEWNPKTILDVGCGFGKFGVLFREYLETTVNKVYDKKDWKTQIDALEVWEKYITPLHHFIYDNIIIKDARKFDKYGDYDLVFLGDILEHMTNKEGQKILDQIKGHYIVTTPTMFMKQGTVFGNPFEKHISEWKPEQFHNWEFIGRMTIGWK